MHVSHAFRESPDYLPLLTQAQGLTVRTLSARDHTQPDLICVAEQGGVAIGSVYLHYDWLRRTWEVGTAMYKPPLTSQVVRALSTEVYWVIHALLDEAEPQMARACELVKAEDPYVEVTLDRGNLDGQLEYHTRGYRHIVLPDMEEVLMRKQLVVGVRMG